MFKKTVYPLLVFLLLILSTGAKPAYSQDFTFEKASEDYSYNYTLYSQAYSEYGKAESFYLKNQTLTLKEDARKKTLVMLRTRDELLRVYLTVLRLRIVETNGLTPDQKGAIFTKIDSEVEWYATHKNTYKDTDSLEDLFNKSSEAKSRYKTNSSIVIYDSLFNITLGDVAGLRLDHEELYVSIKEFMNKNVAEGKLEIDPFSRWLNDIDSVVQNLKKNDDLGKKEIVKLYGDNNTPPLNVFTRAVEELEPSVTLLSQLNNFLTEFLTSINTQLK